MNDSVDRLIDETARALLDNPPPRIASVVGERIRQGIDRRHHRVLIRVVVSAAALVGIIAVAVLVGTHVWLTHTEAVNVRQSPTGAGRATGSPAVQSEAQNASTATVARAIRRQHNAAPKGEPAAEPIIIEPLVIQPDATKLMAELPPITTQSIDIAPLTLVAMDGVDVGQ